MSRRSGNVGHLYRTLVVLVFTRHVLAMVGSLVLSSVVRFAIAHVCCAWSVEVVCVRVSVSMPALVQIIRFADGPSVTAAAGQ